jgi:hypothetical protein
MAEKDNVMLKMLGVGGGQGFEEFTELYTIPDGPYD